MIDYKIEESDVSPNYVEENGKKRKRGGYKQEIIIRLRLEEDQEQQLQDLLMESENIYIQQILETKNRFELSESLNHQDFLQWLAYLLPDKKTKSINAVFDSLMTKFYQKTRTVDSSSFSVQQHSDPRDEYNCRNNNYENNLTREMKANVHVKNADNEQLCLSQLPDQNYCDGVNHQHQSYFHGNFKNMRDAYIALINRANTEGVYLVTNIPDVDKSDGYYKHGSYVILRRGRKCSEISIWIIYEADGLLNTSGSDQKFSSLFELVQYHQEETLPNSDKKLIEPLVTCYRCERCRFQRCL